MHSKNASSLLALEQQVVGSRHIVEPIAFDFILRLVRGNIVIFLKHANYFWVNWYWLLSKKDWWRIWRLVLYDLIPRMLSNVIDRVPLCWIWI